MPPPPPTKQNKKKTHSAERLNWAWSLSVNPKSEAFYLKQFSLFFHSFSLWVTTVTGEGLEWLETIPERGNELLQRPWQPQREVHPKGSNLGPLLTIGQPPLQPHPPKLECG